MRLNEVKPSSPPLPKKTKKEIKIKIKPKVVEGPEKIIPQEDDEEYISDGSEGSHISNISSPRKSKEGKKDKHFGCPKKSCKLYLHAHYHDQNGVAVPYGRSKPTRATNMTRLLEDNRRVEMPPGR